MSFAMMGLTHCRKCYSPLKDNEYVLCDWCRKEEEKEHDEELYKTTEKQRKDILRLENTLNKVKNNEPKKKKYEIKRIGRLALGYQTFISRKEKEDEIEICMWDNGFTHRCTIASFQYDENNDIYELVGSDYLVDIKDWNAYGKLVKAGFKHLENLR